MLLLLLLLGVFASGRERLSERDSHIIFTYVNVCYDACSSERQKNMGQDTNMMTLYFGLFLI